MSTTVSVAVGFTGTADARPASRGCAEPRLFGNDQDGQVHGLPIGTKFLTQRKPIDRRQMEFGHEQVQRSRHRQGQRSTAVGRFETGPTAGSEVLRYTSRVDSSESARRIAGADARGAVTIGITRGWFPVY